MTNNPILSAKRAIIKWLGEQISFADVRETYAGFSAESPPPRPVLALGRASVATVPAGFGNYIGQREDSEIHAVLVDMDVEVHIMNPLGKSFGGQSEIERIEAELAALVSLKRIEGIKFLGYHAGGITNSRELGCFLAIGTLRIRMPLYAVADEGEIYFVEFNINTRKEG